MNLRDRHGPGGSLSPFLGARSVDARREVFPPPWDLRLRVSSSPSCSGSISRSHDLLPVIWRTIPILVLAKALGFLASGQFRGWWRYVSIRDVFPIAAGSALGSRSFLGGLWWPWGRRFYVPRSIYLLDWGITILLSWAPATWSAPGGKALGRRRQDFVRRVLIVGAGAAGQMIAREISGNLSLGMEQVGFIDDDPAKIGARIQGVKVFGGHERIADFCRKIQSQRDHHRDPVRFSFGDPAHRGALPRGIRHVPDPAGGRRPDRRQGQRARAAEPGPGGPARAATR